MADKLEMIWRANKDVRTGGLVHFTGVHGGRRKGNNLLILDVRVNGVVVADHVWLSCYDTAPDFDNSCMKKENAGAEVLFTARLYRSNCRYNIKLTRDSVFIMGKNDCKVVCA